VEAGAQFIQWLKRTAHVESTVGVTFIIVLLAISGFMLWETIKTARSAGGSRRKARPVPGEHPSRRDQTATAGFSRRIQRIPLPPYVSLPASGIDRISVWAILLVAFVGGFFSGFLGGGAGYIRMPCLIYLLGIPTHIAVGRMRSAASAVTDG